MMNLKSILLLAITATLLLLSSCAEPAEKLNSKDFISHQLKIAVNEAEIRINDQLATNDQEELRVSPRSVSEDGELNIVPSRNWTSGFLPGNRRGTST